MEQLKGAVTRWLEVWRSKPPPPKEPPNCSHFCKSTERSSWHLPHTGSWNSDRETESYCTRVFWLDVFGCWWWLGGRHLCICLIALVRVLVTLLSHRQIYADKHRVSKAGKQNKRLARKNCKDWTVVLCLESCCEKGERWSKKSKRSGKKWGNIMAYKVKTDAQTDLFWCVIIINLNLF